MAKYVSLGLDGELFMRRNQILQRLGTTEERRLKHYKVGKFLL
jgi:hypothetical protein